MRTIKLQQKSLDQTGAAIYSSENGDVVIPLFSDNLMVEAHSIKSEISLLGELKHVYACNSLLDIDLTDKITEFLHRTGSLPLNYMNELRSGFSSIYNIEYSTPPIGLSYA